MTTEGMWVTDPSAYQLRGDYICYSGHKNVGCGASISLPFYLASRDKSFDHRTICPACAEKHFGVSPPGVTPIRTECGHSAEDDRCECWGVEMRNTDEGETEWRRAHATFACLRRGYGPSFLCTSRATAELCVKTSNEEKNGAEYRLVRHTPPKLPALAAQGIGDAPKAPSPRRCGLTWCEKPADAHDKAQASRCSEYATEKQRIEIQYALDVTAAEACERKMREAHVKLGEPIGDTTSWTRRATAKRDEALGKLEAQYRALTWGKS